MINISISINELFIIDDLLEIFTINVSNDIKTYKKFLKINEWISLIIRKHYIYYKDIGISLDMDKKIQNISIENDLLNLINKMIKWWNSVNTNQEIYIKY